MIYRIHHSDRLKKYFLFIAVITATWPIYKISYHSVTGGENRYFAVDNASGYKYIIYLLERTHIRENNCSIIYKNLIKGDSQCSLQLKRINANYLRNLCMKQGRAIYNPCFRCACKLIPFRQSSLYISKRRKTPRLSTGKYLNNTRNNITSHAIDISVQNQTITAKSLISLRKEFRGIVDFIPGKIFSLLDVDSFAIYYDNPTTFHACVLAYICKNSNLSVYNTCRKYLENKTYLSQSLGKLCNNNIVGHEYIEDRYVDSYIILHIAVDIDSSDKRHPGTGYPEFNISSDKNRCYYGSALQKYNRCRFWLQLSPSSERCVFSEKYALQSYILTLFSTLQDDLKSVCTPDIY